MKIRCGIEWKRRRREDSSRLKQSTKVRKGEICKTPTVIDLIGLELPGNEYGEEKGREGGRGRRKELTVHG